MTYKTLFLALMIGISVTISGCAAVNSAATPGTLEENYGERSEGARVEDNSIETKIRHNLPRTDARLGDARINVDAYNGVVLLTGQVPSEELRTMTNDIADDVRNVRVVHNELSIAANLPASQRLADTWLNTRIRTSLAANEQIDTGRIRVVTENASVYLMGIVTRSEAERIVEEVSRLGGMERIVKVFDYLD